MSDNSTQQGVAGHGAFFQDTNLSANEAEAATAWVRSHVDRRTMDLGERMDDIRDHMWQLEKEGEIIVHRITDNHKAIEVDTLFGWKNVFLPTTSGTTRAAVSAAISPVTPPVLFGS